MRGPLHEYMQYLSIQTFKRPTSLPQLIAINSPLPQPVSVVVRNYTEMSISCEDTGKMFSTHLVLEKYLIHRSRIIKLSVLKSWYHSTTIQPAA